MNHNSSLKFESGFVNVSIPENNSIMLNNLEGLRLGVWVAHGEGKFSFPKSIDNYQVAMSYSYQSYPGNPNGSAHSVAGISSEDGRHLAIMPHIERSLKPWNWPYYPSENQKDELSPWILAFINAYNWISKQEKIL
jgi:phosphoribosylformylglycinamidine synthase